MSSESLTEAIPPAARAVAPAESSLKRSQGLFLVTAFSVAIFLNAALLFSVQPLFTKMVLPLLGGSPAVWSTCLLFFQALLLGGYLYAHLSSKLLNAKAQAAVHVTLLVLAVFVLPIHIPESWSHPPGSSLPIGWLLGLLTVSLGLPFFLLSAGAPMMQRWFAGTRHTAAQNPYFLYAASNLGSFASLLAYPFVIEPRMRISEQSVTWLEFYYALLVLIGICAAIAVLFRRLSSAQAITTIPVSKAEPEPASDSPPLVEDEGGVHLKRRGALRGSMRFLIEENPSVIRRFLQGRDEPILEPTLVPNRHWRLRWVLLSFAPSSLLIGTTTYLSTDIASVPFLWVIPLALYLLTFVLVFARRPLLPRWFMLHAQLVLGLTLMIAICLGSGRGILGPAILHLTAFFVTAMMCHRELADSRPRAEYLTEFYLWMSLGGVLGGVFNVLLAPVLYDSLVEYPFALVVAFGLRPGLARTYGTRLDFLRDLLFPLAVGTTIWFAYRLPKPPDEWFPAGSQLFLTFMAAIVLLFWKRPIRLALGAGAMYAATQLAGNANSNILMQDRSFFGMYRVRRVAEYHVLQNGTTTHGGQSRELERRMDPLTYYYKGGPLGDIFATTVQKPVRRVAMVGLGTGTIACFGRPDEHWTFYEIDPMVAQIARAPRYFTYLRDCAPRTNIVIGDARVSLNSAADGEFDLIVLDAFSSDAIPAHLMTREAVALYFRKLAPDGVIAFHISNRFLDLRPVIIALANDAKVAGALGERQPETEERGKLYYGSRWMVLAKHKETLSELVKIDGWYPLGTWPASRLWTDDYTDVLGVLKW
jgi:hypothetical protein